MLTLKKSTRTIFSLLAIITASMFTPACSDDGSPEENPDEHTPVVTVTTFAGSGAAGFNDAQGTNAKFNMPTGIAMDGEGNVYVADQENNRIRKITPDGTVTTIAGTGEYNYANGDALTQAKFRKPWGLDVAADGVYVADTYNNAIRKISGDAVTKFAGNGSATYSNAEILAASFNNPRGLVIDATGAMYVADITNHAIRKIANGQVTTLAGGPPPTPDSGDEVGTGDEARFETPYSIALDIHGNIYVADTENHKIKKITISAEGVVNVSTLAGTGLPGYKDGTGTEAQFSEPRAVAVDAPGNVYVADTFNDMIRKITISDEGVVNVTTLANDTGDFFAYPSGITVDAEGKLLYVANQNNHTITRIIVE